ncbi:MBL fold metallo-hydrolase [soil metagenome]
MWNVGAGTPVLAALLLLPALLAGQDPQGTTLASQQRAAEVIRQSVAAHGGAAAIRDLRGMSFVWEGHTFPRTQGRVAAQAATEEAESLPARGEYRIDLVRSRVHTVFDGNPPGRIQTRVTLVANGREFFSYDQRGFFGGTAMTLDSAGVAAEQRRLSTHEEMPILLLRLAFAASPTLRYLGRESVAERTYEVITFATVQGRQISLHIDAETGLLARREVLGEDAIFADAVSAFEFDMYERVAEFVLPRRQRSLLNGRLLAEYRLQAVEFDPQIPDSLFRHPVGYTVSASAAPPRVVTFAEGVYFAEGLGGSYRSMFVDTDEGVVVLDAPVSAAATATAIELIERTLPGRPIRYVVLTHHHADHVAGLRSYVARGATVITAPGTEAYLQMMLNAPRSINRADAENSAAPVLNLETVARQKTIGRGATSIRVINAGPTSHAEGMLVAYLPSHKLLFQGDFLRINAAGGPALGTGIARELDDFIRRRRLDVQHIGAVHGLNGTIEELRAAARTHLGHCLLTPRRRSPCRRRGFPARSSRAR